MTRLGSISSLALGGLLLLQTASAQAQGGWEGGDTSTGGTWNDPGQPAQTQPQQQPPPQGGGGGWGPVEGAEAPPAAGGGEMEGSGSGEGANLEAGEDEAGSRGTDARPQGQAFGLGVGYTFPGDVRTPNTVAARFRLESGLTFEPSVNISFQGTKDSAGPGTSAETSSMNFGFGTQVRIPITSLGPMDFLGIINAGLGMNKQMEPDGPRTLDIFAGYGLGIEFWFTQIWSLSLDTTNPFLSISSTKDDSSGVDVTSTSYSVGAIWNPNLRLIMSLYF